MRAPYRTASAPPHPGTRRRPEWVSPTQIVFTNAGAGDYITTSLLPYSPTAPPQAPGVLAFKADAILGPKAARRLTTCTPGGALYSHLDSHLLHTSIHTSIHASFTLGSHRCSHLYSQLCVPTLTAVRARASTSHAPHSPPPHLPHPIYTYVYSREGDL